MTFELNKTEIEKGFAALEKVMNWSGYLPFTATYSAPLRGSYASLQVLGGIGLAAGRAIKAFATFDEASRAREFKKSYSSLIYVAHGVANYARSEVEHLALPIRLVTAAWDFAGLRFKYSAEGARSDQTTMDMITENIRWLRDTVERTFFR